MRRIFKSNTEFPLTKTTGDVARNRRFQNPSETRKVKRVRFDDAEIDASSRRHEATQSPRCDAPAPKTSEYAYFRKVKDGAVNSHFRALQKENKRLKSSKINYLLTETNKASEKLDPIMEGLKFSDESYEIRRKELLHTSKTRSPLLTETVTPVGQSLFSSLQNHATENSENQCIEKGIFSEKRKRLCQWVANTTSSEVEKLHGKGSDLVSFLLRRLIPKGNENNDSSKGDPDDSGKSPVVHESDNLEKELPLSHKIDCNEDLLKLSSGRSSEIILRGLESFDSGSFTNSKVGDLPLLHKIDCDMDLPKNRAERSSEIIATEWEGFDSGFPSNYRKGGALHLSHKIDSHMDAPKNCAERSSEIMAREWESFDSGFPSNYRKEGALPLSHKIDCHMDVPKNCAERSREIIAREWEILDSGFPSNNHKEGAFPLSHKLDCHIDLQKNCAERSSEIIAREWESFNSGFLYNYHKESDLQNKIMEHSGRSYEIVPSERERFDSRFPYNYHKESDLENETMVPDQHSNSRICHSSETQHGFSFCLPFESFRSLGAFHFKDLDGFGRIIGHGREEPHRLSLEWDFELRKGRDEHGTRKDVNHKLANAWNADQQTVLDNMIDTRELSPSPLFPSHYHFNPFPNYVSTSCLMHEAGPNLDDMKYAMVEPGHFSLTFPSSPKCIPLAEDENAENILSNSNIIFSYRDPRLPKKTVWDCTPRSNYWWKCLSAPKSSAKDDSSGFHAWKYPQNEIGSYPLPLLKEAPGELGTSLSEGAFDHYILSSTRYSPLDAFMNCPLLLNQVSHDIFDQGLYSDDYDNELRYRKLL